jgi:Protein of unknown function (DUF3168)
MPDPAAAFHAAQDAALRASTDLAALFPGGVVRVYSVVPQNATLPYLRIGDDQIIEDADPTCAVSSEIYALVHVWTKPDPPDVQLGRQMAGAIRDTLSPNLTIAGFDCELAEFIDTRHLTDPDGSSHAVLTFHFTATAQPGGS